MTLRKSKTVLRVCYWRVHFKLNMTRKWQWIRLANFVLPNASQYHNYEELPFMKDEAAPHLASPFVCGFTVILLFGGLGVEDNGLWQIPIVLQAICYRGIAPNRGYLIKWTRNLRCCYCCSPSLFRENNLVCLPKCSDVCKMMGLRLKFDTKH